MAKRYAYYVKSHISPKTLKDMGWVETSYFFVNPTIREGNVEFNVVIDKGTHELKLAINGKLYDLPKELMLLATQGMVEETEEYL